MTLVPIWAASNILELFVSRRPEVVTAFPARQVKKKVRHVRLALAALQAHWIALEAHTQKVPRLSLQ